MIGLIEEASVDETAAQAGRGPATSPRIIPAIEDYALIGDCRSAALVSRDASIDWLCWPRFESPALFARLLDSERGGVWSIAPRGLPPSRRRYVGDSAVLETAFGDETAEVTVTDAMPINDRADARTHLSPEHELIRVVTCTRGSAEIDVCLAPRPRFSARPTKIQSHGKLGIRIETPKGLLTLRTDAPYFLCTNDTLRWSFNLEKGETVHFSLTWTMDAPAVLPPLGAWTRACLARTLRHWEAWSARTHYEGPHRAAVIRSAITVRLLAYSPSGAIVAAPTTSLPEKLGGKLNWDYRYCWLRDAAFTVRGLLELGHQEEAAGFTHWLLHATRLTQPRLMVLYDVFGGTPSKEHELSDLAGYAGSRPVRVGNGADGQVQLDSYGEVIDAVWRLACAGIRLDKETAKVITALGRYVCKHWQDPDAGIWEPRGAPRRHTHSIALCWVALDRLIDLQRRGELSSRHRPRFESVRQAIGDVLRARGFSPALDSYTDELDGDKLDATSLLLGWYGLEEASSPRMRGTFRRVVDQLSPRPGLLYRYLATEPSNEEGAFGVCSFWIAEHLAKGGGTLADAQQAFSATAAFANDVGLFAEQIDPRTGRALGNFPQTFTHVGLINAALSLAAREQKEATVSS